MTRELGDIVKDRLAANRQRALEAAERVRSEAYLRCPELYAIDSQMAGAAIEIATAATSSNADEAVAAVRERILAMQARKEQMLGSIGMSIKDLQPPYSCELCRDTGYYKDKRCSCWQEIYAGEAGKRLPRQATDGSCSFDSFVLGYYPERDDKGDNTRATMRSIAEQCAEYAERVGSRAGNLLFIGKTGLGKTHLSLSIAARAAERGKLVLYSSAQGIIDCYERTRFGRSPSSEDWDFVATVGSCDLLVIDDLGSEFVTSFSQSVLYNVINDRMMRDLETVISTNLDTARLTSTYEQRISSRLLCGCKALGFAGKDIRLLKRM